MNLKLLAGVNIFIFKSQESCKNTNALSEFRTKVISAVLKYLTRVFFYLASHDARSYTLFAFS